MKNPFQPTRWERHAPEDALIWFSPVAERIAEPRSFYLSGTRGSGKTTILRSVHWKDLLSNKSLKMQRGISDFEQIGIYLRFPDHVWSVGDAAAIKRNFGESNELEFCQYFSLIVELLCAAKALEAMHFLRVASLVNVTASAEQEVVNDLKTRYPELFDLNPLGASTFLGASQAFERFASILNRALHRGQIGKVSELTPAREIGAFLNFVCNKLSNVHRLITAGGDITPSFRFCLDDCEVLTPLQQRTVNTLVRLSHYPIYWVIAYVGSIVNNRTTLLSAQPLTDADRTVISLDELGDEDFSNLCQSVLDFRLEFALSERHEFAAANGRILNHFPLEKILGPYGVNDFFDALTYRKPFAEPLREAAKYLEEIKTSVSSKKKAPPLYEAYVLALWLGREDNFAIEPDYGERFKRSAEQFARGEFAFRAWVRRKQRAALLHYASRHASTERIPYCGSNTAISLSDGCIRDFLDIMAAMFDRVTAPSDDEQRALDRFAKPKKTITRANQERAFHDASTLLIKGVRSRVDEPEAIGQLVEGLAALTSQLQTNWRDPATLGSPERGVFDIDFRKYQKAISIEERAQGEFVFNLLTTSELAGLIRHVFVRRRGSAEPTRVDSDHDFLPANRTVRVNRRLALEFRFSPRGAYNIVTLPAEEVFSLCAPGSGTQPRKWAMEIYRRLFAQRARDGAASQASLPLTESSSDDE